MAIELVMPRLGWTMEEGTLVEWLKQDGDQIEVGDMVFAVESDKALNEVEALDAGILRIPPNSPAPGSVLKVGTLLAYLLEPGEEMPTAAAPPTAPEQAAAAPAPALQAPVSTDTAKKRSGPSSSPRARRLAAELGVDWTQLEGSGRSGRIIERDIRAAAQKPEVRVSPVARRLATELGVDLTQLAAARPGKRIERADVEAAAQAPRPEPDQVVPLSPVRKITAERMLASARTSAPVTLTSEVDATELVRLRSQLKNDSSTAARPLPSYTDLLVKAAAEALSEHPELNARLQDDGEIALSAAVHVGIAVDTQRGLLVPVLRNAQEKTLRQIAAESAALIEAAAEGQLGPDALRGGTFTLTNLGMYEIDAFTPIINLPECAILGVGRIAPKQVVVDAGAERLEIRQMMFLSLTFDHRLVDGAPAARFVQRLKQLIEQPYLWLVN